MSRPGARPKSAALRLVTGAHNVTRHGDREAAKAATENAAASFGKLIRPTYMKGEARKCWDQSIAPAWWLDGSKLTTAIAFCELWGEFRDGPRMFAAAKHGQLRAYAQELGLTDERNRIAADKKQKDEFFAD